MQESTAEASGRRLGFLGTGSELCPDAGRIAQGLLVHGDGEGASQEAQQSENRLHGGVLLSKPQVGLTSAEENAGEKKKKKIKILSLQGHVTPPGPRIRTRDSRGFKNQGAKMKEAQLSPRCSFACTSLGKEKNRKPIH